MALASRKKIIIGLLVILLLCVLPQVRGSTQREEGEISIVFDFSHNATYSVTRQNFTEAISYFVDYPEYQIRILEDGILTAANLSRSHILVIPNPMENYSTSELDVISEYVRHGGSIFLLSDYQTTRRPIGNPIAVNMILQRLTEARIEFTTFSSGNNSEGDAIIDLENSRILPYNVEVNNSYFYSQLNRETLVTGINSVIVAGGSLTTDDSNLIISSGAETSQAVALSGEVIQNQPGWLSAFRIGSSRIVLCSSTTMFSDTTCAGTNQSWFQSLDNRVLWLNIFRWMSIDLVQDPTQIMIIFVAIVLVAGIVVFAYSLWQTKRE
ncbi:MAG: hypothetical protein ACFFCF_04830 [Promethearchaeota archaeon]